MDEKFKEFTRKLHEILKPLGCRKEGVNYRYLARMDSSDH